jgi:hypothetical protein
MSDKARIIREGNRLLRVVGIAAFLLASFGGDKLPPERRTHLYCAAIYLQAVSLVREENE